jgi:type II secretory ATPase GspE/PulE/Tfp pilus assembly ATPase PilB-like protein
MGVKPFLVASSIQAIMAQRLIRVICKKCKVVDEHPNPKHLRLLGIDPAETKKRPVYKGAGCSACHNTGYKGRLGIFEMIEMNPELRELAYKRATTSELRAAAKAGGMRTLAEDGVLKVFKGISTPEDVSRNEQLEGVVG